MNREIKFRAWFDKNSKEHNYILKESKMEYDVEIDSKGRFLDIEGGWDIINRFNIPIMQYTGLKDKNGVEIYEGDILRVENCYEEHFTVEYHAPEFCLVDSEGGVLCELTWDEWEEGKVIGNIYENPELLEIIKNEKK